MDGVRVRAGCELASLFPFHHLKNEQRSFLTRNVNKGTPQNLKTLLGKKKVVQVWEKYEVYVVFEVITIG